MALFNTNINQLTSDKIESLINNVSESTQIDFKRELPSDSNEDKKEFLADVVSFATSMGGDIIYGIIEKGGVAESINPIAITNVEELKLKLSNIIKDGIEPRVRIDIMEIPCGKGYVIILRVYKLFPGPPMIIFKNNSKFFNRGASGKYQMNYLQIKNAFNSAASINEIFKKFRNERINHFLSGADGNDPTYPFLLFYIYPVNNMELDINDFTRQILIKTLFPYPGSSGDASYNIDGFAMFSNSRSSGKNYLTQNQLFYDSCIEVFDDYLLRLNFEGTSIKMFFLYSIENAIIGNFRKFLEFYSMYSIHAPYIVNLSLINIKNSQAKISQYLYLLENKIVTRDNLIFREYLIDPNPENPIDSLKPMFDDLWRAYGNPKSNSFDDSGLFIER